MITNEWETLQAVRTTLEWLENEIIKLHEWNVRYIDRIEELEKDLKINSALLAQQCNLAREAEIKAMKLEKLLKTLDNANL